MTFFIAFSAFSSTSFTLLGNMTDLVASETGSRVTVMMMMLSEAIETLHLLPFFKAVFRYMSFFTASIAFDKPIFLVIPVSYRLEISNCSFSFLFFFLHLFLILNILLFFNFNINISFITFNNLDSIFFKFILSLISFS